MEKATYTGDAMNAGLPEIWVTLFHVRKQAQYTIYDTNERRRNVQFVHLPAFVKSEHSSCNMFCIRAGEFNRNQIYCTSTKKANKLFCVWKLKYFEVVVWTRVRILWICN